MQDAPARSASASAVPDPGRRALLRGRLHASPPLRPPRALDEAPSVDACTGCGDRIEGLADAA